MVLKGRTRTDLRIPAKPAVNAGKWLAAACDIAQTEADQAAIEAGYGYSEAHVEHFAAWCRSHLVHVVGQWAGQPFELAEWQRRDIVEPLFGWVHCETGLRRFRSTYIEIPKKNGKSTLAAAIGAYMLIGDGEAAAEVYSAGANRDQAAIVHRTAQQMLEASDLWDWLEYNKHTGELRFPQTKSVYRILQGSKLHGLNIHCAVLDELHQWGGAVGKEAWESLKYGARARQQPLSLVVTNAGDDDESLCYKQRQRAVRCLEGKELDYTFLPIVYSVEAEDAEEEINRVQAGNTDLRVARKANPGLGSIFQEASLLPDIREWVENPSEKANGLRLLYGVWVMASQVEWIGESWARCEAKYELDELAEYPVTLGLDLAQVRDMTALVAAWRLPGGRFRVWPWIWVPESQARYLRRHFDVDLWVKAGHLLLTPGETTDYNYIMERMMWMAEHYDVQALIYDQKGADYLTDQFSSESGVERIPMGQTPDNYHEPTETLERLVRDGQLEHPGNMVLNWQVSNAVVPPRHGKRKKPEKRDRESIRTVDAVQAMVMAVGYSHNYQPEDLVLV